ncbi:hypothetical protein TIFTF001_009842 [Ficus carica]|uniref:PdxS/SNZ N-terminal domain-containing protein n=1 Tax=Ficus carica TaxID=3494 RepID=A0AA88D2Y3_FICCA|nr:hypothetical protein TIFTF001_009842 [Ficus carica]
MATAMMAMMMPAISNRTSDTNTNIKNSLFFSLSILSLTSPSTSTLTSSNPRPPLSPSASHLASPTPLSSTRFSTLISLSPPTPTRHSLSSRFLSPPHPRRKQPPRPPLLTCSLCSAQSVFSKEQRHNRHQEEPILDQGRNDPNAARRRHSRGHRCRPSQAHRGRRSLRDFQASFVCECRNLGEALRRVREGAAMGEEGGRSWAVQMGNRETKDSLPWICCTVNQV